jgi:hypothetical protein
MAEEIYLKDISLVNNNYSIEINSNGKEMSWVGDPNKGIKDVQLVKKRGVLLVSISSPCIFVLRLRAKIKWQKKSCKLETYRICSTQSGNRTRTTFKVTGF